jgi:hypothetical protein
MPAVTGSARTITPLLEIAYSSTHKVDRDAGVIRSVKILGRESRNGRAYSDEALAQAVTLYEGLCVNIDHPERKSQTERKFAEGFGYLRNVRRESDGVYGDLVFLKSHALAEQICEAAERMPHQFGLSHHAEGYLATEGGQTVVEGFERIFSVDIVRNPATSRGLFEQHDEEHSRRNPAAHETSTLFEESRRQMAELREQVKRLEAERDARELLESAGIACDPARLKALATLETIDERRALLATWPADPRNRPRSTGPLSESRTAQPLPTDAKSFARAIA